MRLILKTVTPRQGLAWVRLGLQETLRHPLRYLSLFACFMLVAGLLPLIPLLGEVLFLMAVPLLSLAYMMATVGSLRNQPPRLAVFLAPWQELPPARRRQLLILCMAYALAMLALLALCNLIDHGQVEDYLVALQSGAAQAAVVEKLSQEPAVQAGMLARLAGIALLGVPFWHAPALVVWGEQTAAQALFSSSLALWRTRYAFLLYGLGWLGVVLGLTMVVGLLAGLLSLGSAVVWLLMPMSLLLTAAYYVSLFFGFRDSFGTPQAGPDGAAVPQSLG